MMRQLNANRYFDRKSSFGENLENLLASQTQNSLVAPPKGHINIL